MQLPLDFTVLIFLALDWLLYLLLWLLAALYNPLVPSPVVLAFFLLPPTLLADTLELTPSSGV